MRPIATILFALSMFVGGCQGNAGADKYMGVWHRVKYPNETVTVTSAGNGQLSFVAHDYGSRDPVVGKLMGDQIVLNAMTTAVLQENGNLVYDGREYTK